MAKAPVSTLEVQVEAYASDALSALDKLEAKLNRIGGVLDTITGAAKGIKQIGDMASAFKGIAGALNAANKAQQTYNKQSKPTQANKFLVDRNRLLDEFNRKVKLSNVLGNKSPFTGTENAKQLPALLPPSIRDFTKMLPAVIDTSAVDDMMRKAKELAIWRTTPSQVIGSIFPEQERIKVSAEDVRQETEQAGKAADVVDAEWKEVTDTVKEASKATEEFTAKSRDATLFGTRPGGGKRKAADVLGEKYLHNNIPTGDLVKHFMADPNLAQFVKTVNGELGKTQKTGVNARIGLAELAKMREKDAQAAKREADAAKEASDNTKTAGTSAEKTAQQTKKAASAFKEAGAFFKGVGKVFDGIKKALGMGGSGGGRLFGRRGFGGFLQLMVIRRALTSLIRTLTSGIKEGSDNLTQYSSEYNNAISNMTSALGYLKNAWAAAFAPIVTAVEPLVTHFINLLASALNAVGRFMAALTGKGFAVQAKSVWQDYAASLDGTAKSAGGASSAMDDYKKTIMSFDELHVLNDQNKSGSGGGSGSGSGGNGINPSDMFTTVDLTGDSLANFAGVLRQKILEGDWYGVGEAVAQKMNGAIDSIKGGEWAANIARKLNHAVSAYNGWASNFNWSGLGAALGNSVNRFFLTFNWSEALAGIAHTINGLLRTFITFCQTVEWGEIGSKVVEALGVFFDELDWKAIGEAIRSAFEALVDFIGGVLEPINIAAVGEYIADAVIDGIVGFFSGDNKTLVSKLSKALLGLFKTAFMVMNPWLTVLSGIIKKLTGFDIFGDTEKLIEDINNYFAEMEGAVNDGVEKNKKNAIIQSNSALNDIGAQTGRTANTKWAAFTTANQRNATAAATRATSALNSSWKAGSGVFFNTLGALPNDVNRRLYGLGAKSAHHGSDLGRELNSAFIVSRDNRFLPTIAGLPSRVNEKLRPLVGYGTANANSFGNALANGLNNASHAATSAVSTVAGHVKSTGNNAFYSAGQTNMRNYNAGLQSIRPVKFKVKTTERTIGGKQFVDSWNPTFYYANGGFPSADMFFANEAGNPELVGRIGRRPAVANNNQITDALKAALVEGLMQYAMATSATKDSAPYQINLTVKTQNDEVLARAVERGNAKRHSRYRPAGAVR